MNKRLALAVRNPACTGCKLHTQAEDDDVCVTGQGPNGAKVGVVTKYPVSANSRTRREIEESLTAAGLDPAKIMWLSALKCRVWDLDPTKTDMKACRPYLEQELMFLELTHVLALGTEPLFATTGKSGVMKYRGQTFTVGGAEVFATISPSMVNRNPGLAGGFAADMGYFARMVKGTTLTNAHHVPRADQRTYVGDKTALRSMLEAFDRSIVVSYDIETTTSEPQTDDARIVSVAFTTASKLSMVDAHVWEVPLFHPESPWRSMWQQVIRVIGKYLCRVKHRIAHNAKFDTKWLVYWGIPDLLPTFDTIVAAAVLDENRPKGLKPLAQQLLGADPWGIDVKDLLKKPLDEILEYNGLDTWHTLRLALLFRQQLKEQPRLQRLFKNLMMPAIQELVPIEIRGVYVDQQKLTDNWDVVKQTLKRIEDDLWGHIPEDVNDFPDKLFKKNELQVNWNASNFARWFLFEYLDLPVLARGKTKDNGDPGDPSMAEAVLMDLASISEVAKLLLERIEWNKTDTAFFGPYSTQIDQNSRIHSTFKPWGTVTGRLSSGREDKEKVTGKAQNRGVNLQQVPRSGLVRGIFGAAPGHLFIEADYSQIELRVAAWLADERNMLHLYSIGADIHMTMAMRMTGKPAHLVTKEERKRAKAVNFGFLYGMGWAKFIQTAWQNYGLRVTEQESKAFRKSFFDEYPDLPRWHAKQRRLAHTFGRVETPFGRIRHLPDVHSAHNDVKAEAERQAINSPVQGMASDMALLSLVLTAREFRRLDLQVWPIGAVHDAVNFEGTEADVRKALPIIKHTMENLPLFKLFGINLPVPIIADLKVGHHWGGATEVPEKIVTGSTARLDRWILENV